MKANDYVTADGVSYGELNNGAVWVIEVEQRHGVGAVVVRVTAGIDLCGASYDGQYVVVKGSPVSIAKFKETCYANEQNARTDLVALATAACRNLGNPEPA